MSKDKLEKEKLAKKLKLARKKRLEDTKKCIKIADYLGNLFKFLKPGAMINYNAINAFLQLYHNDLTQHNLVQLKKSLEAIRDDLDEDAPKPFKHQDVLKYHYNLLSKYNRFELVEQEYNEILRIQKLGKEATEDDYKQLNQLRTLQNKIGIGSVSELPKHYLDNLTKLYKTLSKEISRMVIEPMLQDCLPKPGSELKLLSDTSRGMHAAQTAQSTSLADYGQRSIVKISSSLPVFFCNIGENDKVYYEKTNDDGEIEEKYLTKEDFANIPDFDFDALRTSVQNGNLTSYQKKILSMNVNVNSTADSELMLEYAADLMSRTKFSSIMASVKITEEAGFKGVRSRFLDGGISFYDYVVKKKGDVSKINNAGSFFASSITT